MRVETQLSAFIENRAGTLARLAKDLAANGISIRAVTIATLADHAVVRLVVSEPRRALHMLEEHGVLVVSTQILAIAMKDEAGALAGVAERLGRAGVNIDYAYGSCPEDGGQCITYLHVSNLTKARTALGSRPARSRAKRR